MKAATILLDTNVWRAIADTNAEGQLVSALSRSGSQIAIAPAVVYETLRFENIALRNLILRIQTAPRWTRLMPEAFLECEEIRAEIGRVRPNWLSPNPDLSDYRRNVRDWTRRMRVGKQLSGLGFWNRVREHPDWMANATLTDRLERARLDSKSVQADSKRKRIGPLALKDLMGRFANQPPGSEVSAWRWPALAAFASHIQEDGNPYRDWLVPWFKIDPQDMAPSLWTDFWIQSCAENAVPRQWLRWAFSYHQTFTKWTDGTPVDEQLSSYLPDCDYVISADKRFVRTVNEIRSEAPFPMATALLIPGGPDGASVLVELVCGLTLANANASDTSS